MASSKMFVTLAFVGLIALAAVGCGSDDPSTPKIPADTTPPAVPANLSVAYNGTDAVLSWDENTVDHDLAGYVIMREHDGQAEALVAAPSMVTSYVDSSPFDGKSSYSVVAVDRAGNESAAAKATLNVTEDTVVERPFIRE